MCTPNTTLITYAHSTSTSTHPTTDTYTSLSYHSHNPPSTLLKCHNLLSNPSIPAKPYLHDISSTDCPHPLPTPTHILQDLKATIVFLERDLASLAEKETDLTRLARAYRTVDLLSAMAERYAGREMTESGEEELRGYVRLAFGVWERAMREQKARKMVARPMTTTSPTGFQSRSSEGVCERSGRKMAYEFSQGTVDRQLCYPDLSVRGGRYQGPSREVQFPGHAYAPLAWVSKPYEQQQHHPIYAPPPSTYPHHARPPHHLNPSAFSKPAKPVDPMRALLDHFASTRTFLPRENDGDEDTLSVDTNPFCSTDAPTLVDTLVVDPVAERVSGVRTYLDGRDNWECDFCGPECFCWGLDD